MRILDILNIILLRDDGEELQVEDDGICIVSVDVEVCSKQRKNTP